MALTYRTAGPWGAGKGSNLVASEVDENFYGIDTRLTEVEENPLEGVSISDITMTGNQMTIHMSDGSTFGPFEIMGSGGTVTVNNAEIPTSGILTLSTAMAGQYIRIDDDGTVGVNVPDHTEDPIPVGTTYMIRRVGPGSVTFFTFGEVNILTPESLTLRKQGSTATIVKVAENVWDLAGDLLQGEPSTELPSEAPSESMTEGTEGTEGGPE